MLSRFYDAMSSRWRNGPRRRCWLFGIAFAEASFFPLPPDALLIPMALAQPRKARSGSPRSPPPAACSAARSATPSAYVLFDQLAQPIIDFYHYHAAFAAFQHKFAQYGVWVILIKGLTPIPYKIVTIAAGAAAFNFRLFMGGQRHHPRRPVLPGSRPAAPFRRTRAGIHRKAAGA